MGCHFLLQGIFPSPGIKPGSPALQEDALPSEPPGKMFQDRPKKEDKRTGKPVEVKYLFSRMQLTGSEAGIGTHIRVMLRPLALLR